MRSTLIFVTICIVLILAGCKTAGKTVHVSPTFQVDQSVELGQVKEVSPGGKIAVMQKGDFMDVLELKNSVRGTFGTVTCDVPPQRFFGYEDDGTYMYAFSGKDLADDALAGGWNNQPCGIYYNKTNDLDVGVAIDTRNVPACIGCGINFMDLDSAVPQIKVIPMINVYAENFLRRTLKFESFANEYLTLYYLEEVGTPNGFDQNGKEVTVDPELREQVLNFDLTESRIIDAAGAKIEILEATPDKLVYKVLQPLTEN